MSSSPLYSLGFEEEIVQRALKLTMGNEEQAVNVILDGAKHFSNPNTMNPKPLKNYTNKTSI
jgi:hypothetical protein